VVVGQWAASTLYASLGFESFGREPHALKVGGDYLEEDYMVLRLARTPEKNIRRDSRINGG
jgi:hypothetical protein